VHPQQLLEQRLALLGLGRQVGRRSSLLLPLRYRVGVVHAPQRRFFVVMAALAVLIALMQGTTEVTELALYAGPVLLLVGLLLCGRFVGEEHIVRRLRCAAPAFRSRRVKVRWLRVPARTLSSLLAHDPRIERGPPACVLAA
jgi:hypothetical protein